MYIERAPLTRAVAGCWVVGSGLVVSWVAVVTVAARSVMGGVGRSGDGGERATRGRRVVNGRFIGCILKGRRSHEPWRGVGWFGVVWE